MGWAYGVVKDREVGYSVEAVCDLAGCDKTINRGLGYLCGSMHGQDDELGCGDYFCSDHLYFGGPNQMCGECLEMWESSVLVGEKDTNNRRNNG